MARIVAMTKAIGRRQAERADAHEDQHAQDFLGRVRDRRQRVRRQHRETRERDSRSDERDATEWACRRSVLDWEMSPSSGMVLPTAGGVS